MRQTKAATRETPPAKLMPTAFDAAAVAASTALIIGMVGSLVFFLIVAFYRGQYDLRLMYIFGLYSAATVLVARIAIESGRTYANAFSLPLAVVSIIAIMQFVTMSGPLGPLSWLVNIGLLALAWYLADRITFDCTLISDRERSLQQGLLQSLGLLRPDGLTRSPRQIAEELSLKQEAQDSKPQSSKKKRHNPGVWVLYFALLAFPLFGLGQLAIPDEQQRGWAFTFLISYLACALSLLVLTSLVGMRRYLRQRGVAMPGEMSMQWLAVGLGSSLAILLLCLVLPLPGRSLGLVGLPAIFQSPESLQTSQWGWGQEGSDNQSNSDAARSEPEPVDDKQLDQDDNPPADGPPQADGKGAPQASDQASDDAPAQPSDQGKSANKAASQSNSNEKESSDKDNSHSSNDSKSSNDVKKSDSKTSDSKNQASQPSDDGAKENSNADSKRKKQTSSQEPKDQSNNQDRAGKSPEPDQNEQGGRPQAEQAPPVDQGPQSDQNDQSDSASSSNPTSSAANPISQLLSQFGSLGELFKWLTIAVLAVIVIVYALTHPSEVVKFWRELCALLAALFGRRRSAEAAPEQASAKPLPQKTLRPFHSFANPFATQLAGWTPAQVVEHTFAALEAWAAEHGMPRMEQQTAAEFARHLAVTQPVLNPHTLVAANMLDQLMFANWNPQLADLQPLAKLWHSLTN